MNGGVILVAFAIIYHIQGAATKGKFNVKSISYYIMYLIATQNPARPTFDHIGGAAVKIFVEA